MHSIHSSVPCMPLVLHRDSVKLPLTLHHAEKGLGQPPAQAPLWNGHGTQQRLEGPFSEVSGVQWARTKEVTIISGNEVSRWHNPVQYGSNTFFLLELGSDGPPPRGGGMDKGGGAGHGGGEGTTGATRGTKESQQICCIATLTCCLCVAQTMQKQDAHWLNEASV